MAKVSAESHPLFNVYQIVLQAQLAAISAFAPARCQQVDDAARRVITEAGYGKFFGHNTGHAIGIEVHEEPRFHRGTLRRYSRMLLTVEPGFICQTRGVRIEDVVGHPQGAEVLYAMPKTVLPSRERHNGFIALKALSEADAIASSNRKYGRSCWKKRIACKRSAI